jgi:hypothetical protein
MFLFITQKQITIKVIKDLSRINPTNGWMLYIPGWYRDQIKNYSSVTESLMMFPKTPIKSAMLRAMDDT